MAADRSDSLAHDAPLSVCLLGLVAVAIVAHVHDRWAVVLPAAAVFCWVPLALDAVLLPRFRNPLKPPSLEVPITAFLIVGILAMLPTWAVVTRDVRPSALRATWIGSLVVSGLAMLPLAWLYRATRERFTLVRKLVCAPLHSTKLPDGAWGAVDGAFASEVLSVGEHLEWHSNDSVSRDPFTNVTYEPALTRSEGGGTVAVRLGEAATLTLVKFDRSTGESKASRGEVIDARCGVRVAGTAQGGALTKSGTSPLLVFASARPNAKRELRRLYRRLLTAQVLAVLGIAVYIAAFVV